MHAGLAPKPTVSDGGWVGSWRPHRPRGPIMALYTSPGPKYMIQGATGFWKHHPGKDRAPAYSFRGAPMPLAKISSPGPYYIQPNIQKTGKVLSPAYSMCKRYEAKTTVTPGPGDYYAERANRYVFKCPPSQTIALRGKSFQVDNTPGPAAYVLPSVNGPRAISKSSRPCYSITGKSQLGGFADDLAKTPGPAAYRMTELDLFKNRAPGFSITTRNVPPGDKSQKPGPGTYTLGRVSLIKPGTQGITFGIKYSDYMAPLIVDVD
ncbi:outer dense fiber protein 3 [Ornithorhynchus anatinus]|uniref:outer dense fiber protein 3 n=1 Tax=Ornithorhynchus anatinus TaxID=9258 RepID=UPI0010A9404C|nr:outer dense fiber protein 3 [Ornithorhynchus anatinus]